MSNDTTRRGRLDNLHYLFWYVGLVVGAWIASIKGVGPICVTGIVAAMALARFAVFAVFALIERRRTR